MTENNLKKKVLEDLIDLPEKIRKAEQILAELKEELQSLEENKIRYEVNTYKEVFLEEDEIGKKKYSNEKLRGLEIQNRMGETKAVMEIAENQRELITEQIKTERNLKFLYNTFSATKKIVDLIGTGVKE